MPDLITIIALVLLTLLSSRWHYRSIAKSATADQGEAEAPGSAVARQSRYFSITTAGLVLIACVCTSLLVRLAADKYLDAALKERLADAMVAADGAAPQPDAALGLLADKIRNRVAFPDLYSDQPADILISNAVSWRLAMQAMVDALSLTSIIAAALIALIWRMRGCRGHSLTPQHSFERLVRRMLMSVSALAILCSLGIVVTLLFESISFFSKISVIDFLFGVHWNPQMAIRADQTAAQGAFGFIPLLSGTVLISAIAIGIAFPVGLLIAVYTSEYATGWQRNLVKPTLEILTGIPTVVYGAFAAIFAGPWLKEMFTALGLGATVESALAVGVIMGIMIIPLVSSLIDDSLRQVPKSIREAMFAIGATRFELVSMVLLPASLPGIVSSLLLAVSRAFGETMIVVMAAGLTAKLSFNPLDAVTTVTVQIATILVGDQAFDSIKTLSAFALGLTLFIITLSLNVLASWVSNRFKVVYQ